MKKYILLLFLFIYSTFCIAQQWCVAGPTDLYQGPGCDFTPYVLLFEDNFEFNTIDFTKWKFGSLGSGSDHSIEKQWYPNTYDTSYPWTNNLEVDNGFLKIITRKETPPILGTYVTNWQVNPYTEATEYFDYTSGRLTTESSFQHGLYEIRCKIPDGGKGYFPAFWQYGESGVSPNKVNNEIDFFEFMNNSTDELLMTVHYDGERCSENEPGIDYSSQYVVFVGIQNDIGIFWYVDLEDGNGFVLKRFHPHYYTILGQSLDCTSLSFLLEVRKEYNYPQDPMSIIVNTAIQTQQWAPNSSTIFPSTFSIDYIRYYKQVPCGGAIIVTDISTLNLHEHEYNYVVGNTIDFSGNFTLENDDQLKAVSEDGVILGFGFTAEIGSVFSVNSEEDLCGSSQKYSNFIKNPMPESLIDEYQDKHNEGFELNVSPNPSFGDYNIEINGSIYSEYNISIFDFQGKQVFNRILNESTKMELDISYLFKGIYIVVVSDSYNNIKTEKLIKL